MGKCGCFFSARQLVSARISHSSGVRCLVVRCMIFNPEGSYSNRGVCANCFTSIPIQEVSIFFGTMRLPPFSALNFFRKFFNFPKWSSFQFFLIFCNRTNVKKIPNGPFFQIFWHYETVQNSLFF